MAQRKPLSKTVRFEVFKRDKFTCQYCGAKAPEAVLHCDHIKPVAEGGENDIMNLLTACASCNGGKGARLLEDGSVVEKQRCQIEELEERRQQIEMMLQWRDELANVHEPIYEAIRAKYDELTDFVPNDHGMMSVRKWVKQYSLDIILDSIEETVHKYGVYQDGKMTSESWNEAFNMVPRFCATKVKYGNSPEIDRLVYIQGIIRRRVGDRYMQCLDDLSQLRGWGYSIEQIESAAKRLDDAADYEVWVGSWISNVRDADK